MGLSRLMATLDSSGEGLGFLTERWPTREGLGRQRVQMTIIPFMILGLRKVSQTLRKGPAPD